MFLVLLNGVLESHLDVLGVVGVFLQTLVTKSIKTFTEVTKNKTRLFQNLLKVEFKFLSCNLFKTQFSMTRLVLTFLQRLVKCTFKKVSKNPEKFQFFPQNCRIFGFTRIAPKAFKALLRNLSLIKNLLKHMLGSVSYKAVVKISNSV